MTQNLFCKQCDKNMGILRDAKIRDGMCVYCKECDGKIQSLMAIYKNRTHDVPEFFKGMFR